jgi:hypothetical protein
MCQLLIHPIMPLQRQMVIGCHRSQKEAFLMISRFLAYKINMQETVFASVVLTASLPPQSVLDGVLMLPKSI